MEMSSGKVGIEFRNYSANFDKYFAIIAKFNSKHFDFKKNYVGKTWNI